MRIAAKAAVLIALGAGLFGCSDGGGGIINLNDKTGTVRGTAYIDQDADGALDFRFDLPAAGASTALVLDGTSDTVARATVSASGVFIMRDVPVGRYQLVASRGTLGDSVAIQQIETPQIVLPVGDTIVRTIRLGFPVLNAAGLATQAAGRRVAIEGIALNSYAAFSDSTIHVWDGKAGILSVRVAPTVVAAGDSVRLVGSVGIIGTKTIVSDAFARVLSASRGLPPVDSLSTGAARTAKGGALAFAQARIANAIIVDTARAGLVRRITVDDGSGRVDIVLDPRIPFISSFLVLGATVQATGLLTLAPDGLTWQLKPRSASELNASFPTYTIAQARTLPSGTRAVVQGKLITSWSAFNDATIHIGDNTGAIRAIRVAPTSLLPGDSVRITGTTGVSNGKPVIADATVTLIAPLKGPFPVDSVSTGAAATADAGRLADAQARVSGGTILDTTRILPEGDLQVGIDDGSGRLVVTLDRDIGFDPAPFVLGSKMRAAGVLTPLVNGGWTLKPRDASEITISFPTVTIAQVRTLAIGARVAVAGIALSRWNTFGDSTVHLRDATGAVRAIRVSSSTFAAGDSIRLLGTIAVSKGSRVLSTVTPTTLKLNVGTGEPDSISTKRASTADSTKLDAGQVRIGGTILGSVVASNGDVVLTVDDGSGRLEVVLDAQISFPGTRSPGQNLRASGLLIPTGAGTWQLYPRSAGELESSFPNVTVAAARATTPGKTVSVSGIAITGLLTFGDLSVHLRDQTGSIRVSFSSSATQIFQGDSIKVIGSISFFDGQPIMVATSVSVLLTSIPVPAADSLSTFAAANAVAPVGDAGQARVHGRITNSQITSSGETQLAIDDGSGALPILLDKDAGFTGGTSLQIGDYASIAGVLIPYSGGNLFQLKPRTPLEVKTLARPDTIVTSFRTTWREYLSGVSPAGWTPRWDRSTLFTVIDEPTVPERKVLQWTGTNPLHDHFAFSYDGIVDTTDVEVYTEFRVRVLAPDTIERRVGVAAVRIGGTATDEHGYVVSFVQAKDGTRKLAVGSFLAGAYKEQGTFAFNWTEDKWYSVRVQAVGPSIQAKVWIRGTAEPADYQVTGGTILYPSGAAGVATQDAGTVQWNVFELRIRSTVAGGDVGH